MAWFRCPEPGFLSALIVYLSYLYNIKVDVCFKYSDLCSIMPHRYCLVACPQSVKDRFLGASVPKASAKVQPFSKTASKWEEKFCKNAIFIQKGEKIAQKEGNLGPDKGVCPRIFRREEGGIGGFGIVGKLRILGKLRLFRLSRPLKAAPTKKRRCVKTKINYHFVILTATQNRSVACDVSAK
jgi:hypothetical protein